MPDAPFSSIDTICDRFEQARRAGDDRPLDAWLPTNPDLRPEVLVELARVELQLRLAAGADARAEEYLDRFPELRADPDRALRVVTAEYQQRRRGESTLTPADYLARFPHLASLAGWAAAFGEPAGGVVATLVQPDGSHPTATRSGVSPPAPDGYELGEEIGRGGMGVVYRARDRGLDRPVAVKALQPWLGGSREAVGRFLEEARITGRLQHPGIPPVHQVGTLPDGRPFLAMKLIAGDTLGALLKARPDPARDRPRFVAVFEGVCQAVGYAHDHGIIHRDLKPHNVMVGSFGEVQVMDWGLAKVLADPARPAAAGRPPRAPGLTDASRPGAVLGTPAFMAPEQAAGAVGRVDARSDVFGLGAVLCAILTGRPPYTGPDAEAVRLLAARGALTPAHQRLDACGAEPELVALCKRCLAPEAADRPADAGEVARAVAGLREAAGERARRAELDRVRAEGDRRAAELAAAAERKRRRVVLAAAVAVAAVLAAGAGVSAWQAVRATDAEREKGRQLELTRAAEAAARAAGETATKEAEKARGAETAALAAADAATKEAEKARKAENLAVETARVEKATRQYGDAMLGFLMDVVTQGSGRGQTIPARDANPNLTLKEAMTFAAHRIGRRFRDKAGLEAPLQNFIGTAFRELGAFQEAEPHLRRSVELYERLSGPGHVYTVNAVHELARLLVVAGRYDEAEPLIDRAFAGFEKASGPGHPDTLYALCTRGWLNESRGQYADAEAIYKRAIAGFEKALPPDHPSIFLATAGLARLYSAVGRYAEAEVLFKRILERDEKVNGTAHPYTLATASDLAAMYRAWGRYARAEDLYKWLLTVREESLGPDSLPAVTAAGNLAGVYLLRGRHAEAEPLLQRAVAGFRTALGPDHPATAAAAGDLAAVYQTQGRFAEAEPHLLAGYDGLSRAKVLNAAGRNRLRWLAEGLARVYERTDRPEKAREWRAKLAALPPEVAPAPRPVK